jgi:hypothetical protein
MAGIADQLKLWAKGRKPPAKGKPSEGEDEEGAKPAPTSRKAEPEGEPPAATTPEGGRASGEANKGPQPPFAKETTPGNLGMGDKDKLEPKNPIEAFAKKAKKEGGKLPPFGGKKAPPFTKEDGG